MCATLKATFASILKTFNMNRFQIALITFLMIALFSCEKNESNIDTEIYGRWKATGFISVESVLYSRKDGFNPVIEIKNNGSYNLKLDANSCIGNYTLSNNNFIALSASGCTKICCDSEFSLKLVQMLLQVKSYKIESNNLKLEVPGWGWINLELND